MASNPHSKAKKLDSSFQKLSKQWKQFAHLTSIFLRQVVFFEKLAKLVGRPVTPPSNLIICPHDFCRCKNRKFKSATTMRLRRIVQKRASAQQDNFRMIRPKTGTSINFDEIFG